MDATTAPASAEPLPLLADDDHDSADQCALLSWAALRREVVTAFDGGDALARYAWRTGCASTVASAGHRD